MEFYIPYRTVATCFKQSKALHLISAQMLVLNCSSLQKIFLFARFRILEYICDQLKPPFFKKGVQSYIFSTHILCSFVSNTHIIKLCSLSSVYENEKKERKIINWRLLYLPSSKISSCVRTADTGLCLHTWAALLCQGDATYHDR